MSVSHPTPNSAADSAESPELQSSEAAERGERRARERYWVSDRAILRRNGASEYAVDLVDLSEDGAGVWSSSILVPGETVELLLPQRRSERLVVDAVVVGRKALTPRAWRVSLQFLQRLRPEQLASALD